MLDAAFFKSNRRRLVEQLALKPKEFVVVPANTRLQSRHDEAYPFMQDSNFYYLTGLREPDYLLVLTLQNEWLLGPSIEAHHQLWDGQMGLPAISHTSGVEDIQAGKDYWARLDRMVGTAKRIYLPLPYRSGLMKTYYRMVPNPARATLVRKLRRIKPKLEIADARPALADLRMAKQPVELDRIQQAIRITLDSIDALQIELPKMKHEYEAEALLRYEFRRRGADGLAFESIVASGKHSAQIHYTAANGVLDKSHVLLDLGAAVDGYAADISRTLISEKPTPLQKEMVSAVRELQSYVISLLKPGVDFRDYEEAVERRARQFAKQLDLKLHDHIHGKRAIPHAISHHLGLDVHDAADYKRPMEAGMVLTVEPGLYALDKGIGVRIEDDVLITSDGSKILSPS